MMCEVCRQKSANVVFKTITDGQVATRAMCMDCAQNLQQDMYRVFLALGLTPGEPATPSRQQEAEKADAPVTEMPNYLCASCGRPFDSLDEHTMAGCAHCYDAMEKELGDMLEGDKAVRKPDQPMQARDPETSKQELKYKLLEAVMKEDFETAALLRDEIARQDKAVTGGEEP